MNHKQHTISSREVVIIDFETTGLSASYERIIEVGAAIVKDGKIIDTYSQLCYPGRYISFFITELTGITNSMVKGKPKPEKIMPELYNFIGNRPILAHNASFDSQFLQAEMARVNLQIDNPTLCTLLLSRRLIQNVTDHKLGTLKQHIRFKSETSHQDHRALDDVKVTAALWRHLQAKVTSALGMDDIPINVFQKISKMPKGQVPMKLNQMAQIYASN